MKIFNSEHAGNGIKMLGNIAAFVVVSCLTSRALHSNETVSGYYDAVRAIMNSSMFADDKRAAVEAMKQNGSTEYYKTVINIVNTSMFADDKIEMIKSLG
jgi:hypothetical protein